MSGITREFSREGIKVRIKDAYKGDAGRGRIRIDPEVIDNLNLRTGDVIEISHSVAGKKTAALLFPGKLEDKGTNTNGTKNEAYCSMCFKDGKFIQPDITMEGMIELAAKGLSEFDPNMSYEQAKDYVSTVIPQLKRWKQ